MTEDELKNLQRIRERRKRHRARKTGGVSERRVVEPQLPFSQNELRVLNKGRPMIFVGDMLAYDMFRDFQAFSEGAKAKMSKQARSCWIRRRRPAAAGPRGMGPCIGRTIAGGQLAEIVGKRARIFMVPSLTEVVRAVRAGDAKCVAYTNKLLQRTFRMKKLVEDAGDTARVSVYWLLSPQIDECDRETHERYTALLKTSDAVSKVNSAIDEVNRIVGLATNEYDIAVLDLRLFMSSAFFSNFRSDGFRFMPSHIRYVTQLVLARILIAERRSLSVFARLREQWNTWALATWKLEVLQASQHL
ncbi:hypothetical protein AAVH_07733 [Aphelenchoides avenae]|nr:hypothetical protein AAVH_07733 [Aphelenchus avenae]